ncbi:hypothetical protein EfmAA96_35540 (plasmid) [Enterococcus faecium]|nr:hypothetical protein EfmAA96_35540 [Enterococcus faecium]
MGNNSVAHLEIIDHIKGSYEYLTHESKDAKEKNKHVYDKKDILHINDFDIDRYISLDENQKRELGNLVLSLIRKYELENIIDLGDFVEMRGEEYGLPSMEIINDALTSRTGLLRLYFDGNYQRRKSGKPNWLKEK